MLYLKYYAASIYEPTLQHKSHMNCLTKEYSCE